jgi:oligoribonuclease
VSYDDSDRDVLIWCDLETTGLDPAADCILEGAFIITDLQLNRLEQPPLGPIEMVAEACYAFQATPQGWERMMADPIVRDMHTASGLIAELETRGGTPPGNVDIDLSNWLQAWMEHAGATKGVLAGSGVERHDRPFITRHLPRVDRLLRYYTCDIGPVRRTWRWWTGGDLCDFNERKPHRAAADLRLHLDEARAFRDRFQTAVELRHPWDEGYRWRAPWGGPHPRNGGTIVGDGQCYLCWHGDGDPRCVRCGRSTGGPWVCECPEGPLYGSCVMAASDG